MTFEQSAALGRWLRRRAENVTVALLSVMFATFIVQIFFRYVLNNPIGWSEEVIITTWLWTVLWGAAFILGEAEEIRFDIIYSNISEGTRRIFTVITGVALVFIYGISLPAAYRYVSFMKVEQSAYLHVPINGCIRSTSFSPLPASAAIAGWCIRPFVARNRPRPIPPRSATDHADQSFCPLYPRDRPPRRARPADRALDDRRFDFLPLLSGLDLGTAAEQILNGLFNSYVLLAIPLFILAADLMNIGSLTDRLLQFCLVLVGRFRGGLGHVNVVANMIFAGMSGSAIADAVGIGRIIIGMMTKDGRYPVAYAGAITASAAIIGPIIPPSIPMVVYALVSDASIGYLFLGGFVPGVMLGIGFMIMNSIIARRRNYPGRAADPAARDSADHARAFPALMLPVILLFGIYGGVMTPTEGAAAAAFYALFASAVLYRAVTWQQLYEAMLSSGKATTSIGMLIAGAHGLQLRGDGREHSELAGALHERLRSRRRRFLLLVNIILLILGCLLEGSTILLVVVPIFIPTAKALGIDLVHFGVVVVVNIMIGLLTPPYGLLLFVLANMTKQPLGAIVREAAPFILMAILVLAIITAVPDSILWLPRLMGYKG